MDKLCSLKEVVPGSVIEIPGRNLAVAYGLQYDTQRRQTITTTLLEKTVADTFVVHEARMLSPETQCKVIEDPALLAAVAKSFGSRRLQLAAPGVTSGCDPEIFVEHGDGSIFPAWEFMPDEKTARAKAKEWLMTPRKVRIGFDYVDAMPRATDPLNSVCYQGNIPAYWDGAQAEIAPWAKGCLETLHYGTREGLKIVLDLARAKDPTAKLTLRNVVELSDKVLKETPDQFIRFRCSQSYNVYNDPAEAVLDPRTYKYRCSGGHIHFGFHRTLTAPGIEQIIRGLDAVLGVAGVSLAAGIDNPERRNTYGRAGEFRLPEHGIEYRVLSNFWLCHPAVAMLVFDVARSVVRLAESGLFNICWKANEAETREVINNCDVEGARKILARNGDVLNGLIYGTWRESAGRSVQAATKMRATAMKAIMNGILAVVPTAFDIEKNWKLNGEFLEHCRGANENWQTFCDGV